MSFLVQLTDTHIVEPGKLLYGKVDTAGHLADAVEQVNRMSPQPDLVLITGDLVEHPGPVTYGNFAALIEPLQAPVYLLPGNHDDPKVMCEHFCGSGAFPTTDDTYQYAIERDDFRVLMLNSHFDGSELPSLGPRRLAWLEAELEKSTQPTLIAIHHPPMRTGVEFIDMGGPEWYSELSRLINHHQQVQLVICGHGHCDIYGRNRRVPVYMAGSTAHQLIAGRGNDHAPAFDERPAPPVLHHWLDAEQGFVSGANPWPAWSSDRRIDLESGLDWETLKDQMRGSMR